MENGDAQCLIETGFLTNPEEENYLASEKAKRKLPKELRKHLSNTKKKLNDRDIC